MGLKLKLTRIEDTDLLWERAFLTPPPPRLLIELLLYIAAAQRLRHTPRVSDVSYSPPQDSI